MNEDTEVESETVELPASVVEEARERCEVYGFPTTEGFIEHAIKFLLSEEPTADEEHIEKLLESRRQVNRGETYSIEEVMEELNID